MKFNNMIFYLNGSEKLGPFTIEEFINLKLDSNVLVYSDDWGSWQHISDLAQLNILIDEQKVDIIKNTKHKEVKINKKPIIIKPIYIYLLLLIFSVIISYIVVINKKIKCLDDIKLQTEKIFEGKNSISEYNIKNLENGKFHKLSQRTFTEENQLFKSDEIGFQKTKVVFDTTGYNPKDTIYFKTVGTVNRFKKWNQIIDYFDNNEISVYDGASLSILSKKSDTEFRFTVVTMLDMAYLVPEFKNYDYGYGYSGKSSTYRPTLENAYRDAALFIINDEESNFEKGNSDKIWSFEDIDNDLYEIGANYVYYNPRPIGDLYTEKLNRIHSYEFFSFDKENSEYTYASKNVNAEKINFVNIFEDNIQITNNKYISENANISDDKTIVWYCKVTNNLVIIEKINIFYKFWAIYATSIFVFFVLIIQLFKNFRRFKFN